MPKGAVYVGRGSKWGNPHTFANSGNVHPAMRFACETAPLMDFSELRGKDIACSRPKADGIGGHTFGAACAGTVRRGANERGTQMTEIRLAPKEVLIGQKRGFLLATIETTRGEIFCIVESERGGIGIYEPSQVTELC